VEEANVVLAKGAINQPFAEEDVNIDFLS